LSARCPRPGRRRRRDRRLHCRPPSRPLGASWVETYEREPGLLVESESDVHRLNAVARRALDQVIDRAEGNDPVSSRIERKSDVREVRSREKLRLGIVPDAGALLDDPDERLGGIGVAVDLPERLLVERGGGVDVRRRQYPTHELDRGDREIDARVVSAETQ